MVDVKLESVDTSNLPKDVFVSLRVGEAQKLARCSAKARHFKFPEKVFADRRYGKVEVFRHIGSGSFSVGAEFRSMMQELSLSCSDDHDDLRFRITMGGEPAPEEAEQAQASTVSIAKRYLEKHQLELRMAEAMDLLLRELPEDPIDFLFGCLRRNATMRTNVTKVEADAAVPPEAPAERPTTAEVEESKSKAIDGLAQAFGITHGLPESAAPPPLPERSAAPPPPAKSAAPQCAEAVRKAAAGQLLSGFADGRLEEVLATAPRESPAAAPSQQVSERVDQLDVAAASEQLRNDAREMLLAASGDGGKLDEALASMGAVPKESHREQEQLRVQFAAAASDGRLMRALAETSGVAIADDVLVRDQLAAAASDGRLMRALAETSGVAQPP